MSDQILDRINGGERFPVLAAIGHMIRHVEFVVNSQNSTDADKLISNYKPLKNNTATYNGIERRQAGTVRNRPS